MSDDLISRSELKKEIEGMSCTDYCDIFDWKVNEGVLNALNDVKDIIDDMPTAYDEIEISGLILDINPTEICSHIEIGNLSEWCDSWKAKIFSELKGGAE